MIRLWLAIYYSLTTFVLYFMLRYVLNEPVSSAQFINLAKIFNFFSVQKSLLYAIVFIISFFALCFCIIVHKKALRIFTSLLFLLCFAMYHSFGAIGHAFHIWAISIIFVGFLDEKTFLNSKFNKTIIRLVQALCFSHYFLPGLHKVWHIFESGLPDPLYKVVLNATALAIAHRYGPGPLFMEILIKYPWFVFAGWVAVILFQLSCIIPILTGRHIMLWGFFSIGFHFSTALFLGIYFEITVLGALFLFILTEKFIEWEMKFVGNSDYKTLIKDIS